MTAGFSPSSRTQVKICGISTPDAMSAAQAAGADAVGFVFFPPSPRAIQPDRAAGLAETAPNILKVGLFVDADDALLQAAARAGALGAVQLQGTESPARVQEVRSLLGLPVWKAVGVRTPSDVRAAARAYAVADLLLLDAKPPEGAPLPGGNGLRFDWQILSEARPRMAWGLAGGLTVESVTDAIRLARPPLVDVSSGVEDAPGAKNLAKLAAFVEAARRA